MCGIAAIVARDPRESVDEARFKRMRDALRHRGPGGQALWIDQPVWLGHRRPAIVDVASGQQPMSNEDGTLWITFHGEIYKHAPLRPDSTRPATGRARLAGGYSRPPHCRGWSPTSATARTRTATAWIRANPI